MIKLDYYNQYSFFINANSSSEEKILAYIYSSLCSQARSNDKHSIDNFYIDVMSIYFILYILGLMVVKIFMMFILI